MNILLHLLSPLKMYFQMGQQYTKVADDMVGFLAQNFSALFPKGILLHSHNANIIKRNQT